MLIISGRGFGQYRRVTDNTTNTLTLAQPWNVTPDATTEYVVSAMFIENAFFPRFPSKSADSLAVLLGAKAAKLLVCPTCSTELRELGLNYAWNQKVSGRKLSDLTRETWLLMDCVGAHYWLVDSHNCGHRGKVNVLYADGSVKQMTPYSTDDWQKSPSGMWKDWARE